jgi:hypothetical protein
MKTIWDTDSTLEDHLEEADKEVSGIQMELYSRITKIKNNFSLSTLKRNCPPPKIIIT